MPSASIHFTIFEKVDTGFPKFELFIEFRRKINFFTWKITHRYKASKLQCYTS